MAEPIRLHRAPLPDRVVMGECWARDGLQNERLIVPTDAKVEIITGMVEAGFKKIEATSFAHPKYLPQFADAEEVLKRIPRKDGVDYRAICTTLKSVERAVKYTADVVRETGKPRFVELRTYRFRAHSMYDAEKYREKAEVVEWQKRDPIELLIARMQAAGIWEDSDRERLEAVVKAEVEKAVVEADAAPLEPIEDLAKDVYTEVAR